MRKNRKWLRPKQRRAFYTIRNPYPTRTELREQREQVEFWIAARNFVGGKARSATLRLRNMERVRARALRRRG